jgi:fatty-acyl-CoA synthase
LAGALTFFNKGPGREGFVSIINHSGARPVGVDRDYVDVIEAIRDQLPGVERFVALEGAREGWLDYEAEIAAASEAFDPVDIDENDLITINYTSGATAKRFRTAAAGPALSAAWP